MARKGVSRGEGRSQMEFGNEGRGRGRVDGITELTEFFGGKKRETSFVFPFEIPLIPSFRPVFRCLLKCDGHRMARPISIVAPE